MEADTTGCLGVVGYPEEQSALSSLAHLPGSDWERQATVTDRHSMIALSRKPFFCAGCVWKISRVAPMRLIYLPMELFFAVKPLG